MELTQDQLHVEERQRAQGQHHDVGDEEGSSSVLVAEVGEPPHIGQVHREPDDAEEEVQITPPGLSLRIIT